MRCALARDGWGRMAPWWSVFVEPVSVEKEAFDVLKPFLVIVSWLFVQIDVGDLVGHLIVLGLLGHLLVCGAGPPA